MRPTVMRSMPPDPRGLGRDVFRLAAFCAFVGPAFGVLGLLVLGALTRSPWAVPLGDLGSSLVGYYFFVAMFALPYGATVGGLLAIWARFREGSKFIALQTIILGAVLGAGTPVSLHFFTRNWEMAGPLAATGSFAGACCGCAAPLLLRKRHS